MKPCNCFMAGTRVLLSDGKTEQSIETFVGGELVMSHTWTARRVIRPTTRIYSGTMVDVAITEDSDTRNAKRHAVTSTFDHAFLLENGIWILACEIRGGAAADVLSCMGKFMLVNSTPQRWKALDLPVYCLEVEEDHSFIANGFSVHNCSSIFK